MEDFDIEPGITCVRCHNCGFAFSEEHIDCGTDDYSCPNCAEGKLTAEIARLREELRHAKQYSTTDAVLRKVEEVVTLHTRVRVLQEAGANVIDFLDQLPNDIKTDPGFDSLHRVLHVLRTALGDPNA